MSRYSRYCRGNLDMSNKSLVKSRCKLCLGLLSFLMGIYFSFMWINWDAAVVFKNPNQNDIYQITKEVEDKILTTSRWKEKKIYIRDVFIESCQSKYDVLTNLNINILGTRVLDSLVYICSEDILFVNLRINPQKRGTRLVCNETYGDLWKINDQRYHPLEYSFVKDNDIARIEANTTNYKETCMLYQANELLKGEWKPSSIKDQL